jgi:hypothetical protein
MIKGMHAMYYSSDAMGLRNFLRDKLGLEAFDIGEGWLIFNLREADLGCHPTDKSGVSAVTSGTADISFYCDDIQMTVAELKEKGVEFKGEIEDHGYGLVTYMKAPGDFFIQLYQPAYQK